MNRYSKEWFELELDSYFVQFYRTDEALLICSGEKIFSIDPSGNLNWRSKSLGLDGVLIDKVEDNKIYGQGEWDPPGGWIDFTLNLKTGKELNLP